MDDRQQGACGYSRPSDSRSHRRGRCQRLRILYSCWKSFEGDCRDVCNIIETYPAHASDGNVWPYSRCRPRAQYVRSLLLRCTVCQVLGMRRFLRLHLGSGALSFVAAMADSNRLYFKYIVSRHFKLNMAMGSLRQLQRVTSIDALLVLLECYSPGEVPRRWRRVSSSRDEDRHWVSLF
jgi:hypothetical protein